MLLNRFMISFSLILPPSYTSYICLLLSYTHFPYLFALYHRYCHLLTLSFCLSHPFLLIDLLIWLLRQFDINRIITCRLHEKFYTKGGCQQYSHKIREVPKTMNLTVRFIRFFHEAYHDAKKYFIARFSRKISSVFIFVCL